MQEGFRKKLLKILISNGVCDLKLPNKFHVEIFHEFVQETYVVYNDFLQFLQVI